MRTLLTYSCLGLFFAAFAAGCDEESSPDPTGGETAPPFDEGTGQEAVPPSEADYPLGPYGNEIGSVLENFRFYGFADPSVDSTTAQLIQLADFYNPTGDGVFPEGSIHGAGKPKPRVLFFVTSARWCGPCQRENDVNLPVVNEKYAPKGASLMLALIQDNDYGPATFKDLQFWTNKYDTSWPAVIDPTGKTSPLWDAQAFPANMLIDTTTMTLLESVAGSPIPPAAAVDQYELLYNGILDVWVGPVDAKKPEGWTIPQTATVEQLSGDETAEGGGFALRLSSATETSLVVLQQATIGVGPVGNDPPKKFFYEPCCKVKVGGGASATVRMIMNFADDSTEEVDCGTVDSGADWQDLSCEGVTDGETRVTTASFQIEATYPSAGVGTVDVDSCKLADGPYYQTALNLLEE